MKKKIFIVTFIVAVFFVACADSNQEKKSSNTKSQVTQSPQKTEETEVLFSTKEGSYKGNNWTLHIWKNNSVTYPKHKEGAFVIDGEELPYEKEIIGKETVEYYADEAHTKKKKLSVYTGFYKIYKSTDTKIYDILVDLNLDEEAVKDLVAHVFGKYVS